MSDCCVADTNDGRVPSGGEGLDVLFRVTTDRVSAGVFPVITSLVNQTISANRLDADGDMIDLVLGGNVENTGGATTFAPFIGIDASFAFGAVSVAVPAGVYPWFMHAVITRKSALTYTLIGDFHINDFTTALVGIGDIQGANVGGAIAAPNAEPACNWAIAQQLLFNISAAAAGTFWRIKGGRALVV